MAAPATGSHVIPRGAWARRPSRFVVRRNEVLTGRTMDARRRRLIVDGLAAAGIGYVLVAAFVALVDALAGHAPLYTAAFIGRAVLDGVREPVVPITAGPVLAASGLHMVACLLLGFLGAWLEYETELHPELWYLTVFLFVGAAAAGYAGVLTLMALIGNPLSTGVIVLASLLAVAGIATYLVLSHRGAVRRIRTTQQARLGRVE